ncbi:uncharacterized protein LOC134780598 [Penaeus indicus]|uniref:uncharacterized protein LOC134780598 n=1 Tax=Penaeus indicus TaxID=29960 RepID=UPI00300C2E91
MQEHDFDLSKVIKFVPNFDESDPEEYFGQFEHVATTLKWPRHYWPILVQSSLKGKGRCVYLSLAGSHQSDYDTMKDAILKAYQLSAEFYRNRFRNCVQDNNQSFVEYMHKISKLQTRWLSASNVSDYERLKELMLLEQFIRGVSPEVRMYLLEREVNTVERAALLAENFNLISKSKVNINKYSHPSAFAPSVDGKSVGRDSMNSDFVAKKNGYGKGMGSGWSSGCFYCKKIDHIKANCPKLLKKGQVSEPKPVANYTFVSTDNVQGLPQRPSVDDHDSFHPFIFSGSVALNEAGSSVPVSAFRDTGASYSVILKEAVPFVEKAYTGKFVVVEGFGGCVTVPLFAYDPAVDVARNNPGLFPACAVTKSQAKKLPRLSAGNVGQDDLSLDCLFGDEAAVEKSDESLMPLLNAAMSKSEIQSLSSGYYLNTGILMRKYRPPEVPATDLWNEVFQVVVPTCYRSKVIGLAHDLGGGHLVIKKTLDKVIRYFYWLGIKSDVTKFLLTLMCASTRYPEAIPLKRATSRTIVPVLIKFFTQYGMSRVLQSDQGSNFWSVMFQEVMKLLHIKQYSATAYRPQTQGALERYHQTLKSMLTKYCQETGNEWDLGVPLMLYAIRCTEQESLGFSPYELLFGRDIRGPMKLLYESWIGLENSVCPSDYVEKMKTRLQHLQKYAHENLESAQWSMKEIYDRKAAEREFAVVEKVLLFLPIRRKKKKIVHINLKKYHSRRPDAVTALCLISGPEERGDTTISNEMESEFVVGDVGFKLQNSDILKNPASIFSHLPHKQQQDILCVLQEFSDVLGDVPRQTHLVTHDVSFLLKNGLAELSESEWASPCALVPKPKGWRMVTDYRRVNELTKGDCYPLLRILDIIDSIGESKFITVIDLLKGYYQNAPSSFQRLTGSIIRGLKGVKVYIDDLVVYSSKWEDHVATLRSLFEHLQDAGLTVNLVKSEFAQAKVRYLGHEVGGGEVAPVKAKVEAINELLVPKNKRAVQRFIGMAGYYRRFCPNFADVAKPLTDLLSPKKEFKWTVECQESFKKLKNFLTCEPVLRSPDFDKPITLQVDASVRGCRISIVAGREWWGFCTRSTTLLRSSSRTKRTTARSRRRLPLFSWLLKIIMSAFKFDEFVESPSLEAIEDCDWVQLARHFDVTIRAAWRKSEIKK